MVAGKRRLRVRRILLVLASMALVVAVAVGGPALADPPPGAGCQGIENAHDVQKANAGESNSLGFFNSNLKEVAKAHRCEHV